MTRGLAIFRVLKALGIIVAFVGALGACAPRIQFFSSGAEPLAEYTLQGSGADKVALIRIQGVIDERPDEGMLSTRPSMVHGAASRLRKAAADPEVKALVLAIDSPGGTVTGSDILYHEIMRFKERNGGPVTASLLGLAASGGYYAAAAADHITAHPTTITGSIGTIFVRPDFTGLMDKIGVGVEVTKSGELKDVSAPYRESTPEERRVMQEILDDSNQRFLDIVRSSRGLSPERMKELASARVYPASRALELDLVDEICYLDEALDMAKARAGLAEDARVVVYRRDSLPDDTPYNTLSMEGGAGAIKARLPGFAHATPRSGFHYLWLP